MKDPRQELFNHLQNEHQLTCLETEMDDIINIVQRISPPVPTNAMSVDDALYDCTGMLAENHPSIIEAMELYARSSPQLKAKKLTWEEKNKIKEESEKQTFYPDCSRSEAWAEGYIKRFNEE